MKINILIIATSLALVTGAMAQTVTATPEAPPTTNSTPTPKDIFQGLLDAFNQGHTNWLYEAHAIYAPGLQHKWGAGIGVFYPLTTNSLSFYTGVRLDFVDGGFYMPQGSVGMQKDIQIFSWLDLKPFTYVGVGVPLSGATIAGVTLPGTARNNDGQPTAILGYGVAMRIYANASQTFIADLIYDREEWTGFSGQQQRIGFLCKLPL